MTHRVSQAGRISDLLCHMQPGQRELVDKFENPQQLIELFYQLKREGYAEIEQQTISSLESKALGFELQLKQLSEKANQSNLQVQDIAVKAIEGASRQRFLLEKSAEAVKA